MKPILLIALLIPVISFSQKEYVIDSILWEKGQTMYVRAREVNTDSVGYFSITFMGMGKRRKLVGLSGKYYPSGFGRRRTKFILPTKK